MINTPISYDEIATRNETARRILAGFATAAPYLPDFWDYLDSALADAVVLSAEVSRLSAAITATRLDRANLLAAMRATIAAYADGETDFLWYLREELNARQRRSQGHGSAS